MQCYVKRRSDFKTVYALDVYDYDVVIDSIYDENGSISVVGEVSGIEGNFIYFNGWIGIVDSVAPERGTTVITTKTILSAFARPLVPVADGSAIEPFIKLKIESEYKNLSDAVYRMPYLSVSADSTTGFISPDVEDGFWNLRSYIAKVRRLKGVFVTWGIDGDTLTCAIGAKTVPVRIVDFADTAHRLQSESYSRYTVGKITAIQTVDNITTQTHYYAHADGTYSTTDEDRVSGEWIVIATDADGELDAVAEEFARSSYSHLIEFYSDRKFDFYDSLRVRVGGRVLQSYISSVRVTKSGTLYRSGELRRTLTDKLKELI